MKTCAEEGAPVWLSHTPNPHRKLAYTWELAKVRSSMVCVNTAWGNRVVGDALENHKLDEFKFYRDVQPEVRLPSQSRLDFLLIGNRRPCYLEVKMVTMSLESGIGAFPDSITKRGTRHLCELLKLANEGADAVLFFVVLRTRIHAMRPAAEIDPVYARTLREAQQGGVKLVAYNCRLGPTGVWLNRKIPIVL